MTAKAEEQDRVPMYEQEPRDRGLHEVRVDAVPSATVNEDYGAIRTIDPEPPAFEDDPVAAVEGHVFVGGRDRARRRIEREALDLRHRFRHPERDREVSDQRRDDDDREEIGP